MKDHLPTDITVKKNPLSPQLEMVHFYKFIIKKFKHTVKSVAFQIFLTLLQNLRKIVLYVLMSNI